MDVSPPVILIGTIRDDHRGLHGVIGNCGKLGEAPLIVVDDKVKVEMHVLGHDNLLLHDIHMINFR